MLTIETVENTKTNYLKYWCQTCARTYELLDYGVEEVAPGAIEQLQEMARKHELRNHKHQMFIYEGKRLPTNQEIRKGIGS